MLTSLKPRQGIISYFSKYHKCAIIVLTRSDIMHPLCSVVGSQKYGITCAYKGCTEDKDIIAELDKKSEAWGGDGCRRDVYGFIKVESHYLVKYAKRNIIL